MKTMTVACLTMAAIAGEPSFKDGHWYHTDSRGKRSRATPNKYTIKDGEWFHEGTHINGKRSYTRDRYGNYLEH